MVSAQSNVGLHITKSSSPIQGLVVGDVLSAIDLSSGLLELGFRVPAIRPPTVPSGTSRIRLTLSADHTVNDIDRLMDALHILVNKLA